MSFIGDESRVVVVVVIFNMAVIDDCVCLLMVSNADGCFGCNNAECYRAEIESRKIKYSSRFN